MKSHILWDYFGRLSGTIIQFLVSIVLTRLLSPSDYGIVGITMAVNGIISIFGNFGFGNYIIQATQIDKKILSSIFWFNILIGLLLYLILFVSSNFIANFYGINELKNVLIWTGLNLILSFIGTVHASLLIKEMEFKQINIRNIIISTITGAIAVVLAYQNFGVWALIFQSITSSFLTLLVNVILSKWLPSWVFRIGHLKDCFKFGSFMFLAGLLEGIYSRLDVFIIGKVFNTTSLGYYTRAQSLDGMVKNLSSNSLLSVLLPAFAKIKDNDVETEYLYYKYFELICFIFCLLAGCFYLIATPLFNLLFGSRWNISASYFQLLVISGFIYPLSALMLTIIEARGNSKSFFHVEILKKVVTLPMYIIVFYFGIKPYLYALNILYFLALLLNLSFLNKEIPIGYKKSITLLFKYILTGLIIAIFLFHLIPFQDTLSGSLFSICILIIFYMGIHYYKKSTPLVLLLKQVKLF